MAQDDEKKINYKSFQDTISKLTELSNNLNDEKNKLSEANKVLTDEESWKGESRNYYCGIASEQEKKLNEINDELNNFISDLRDTLGNFTNLDILSAQRFRR